MSYAVKNDGSGFRAIDDSATCGPDETFSEIQPKIKLVDNSASTRLIQIDRETLRPLRAVYAGTDTEEDHAKLAALEEEAQQLRQELVNAN